MLLGAGVDFVGTIWIIHQVDHILFVGDSFEWIHSPTGFDFRNPYRFAWADATMASPLLNIWFPWFKPSYITSSALPQISIIALFRTQGTCVGQLGPCRCNNASSLYVWWTLYGSANSNAFDVPCGIFDVSAEDSKIKTYLSMGVHWGHQFNLCLPDLLVFWSCHWIYCRFDRSIRSALWKMEKKAGERTPVVIEHCISTLLLTYRAVTLG